MLTIKLYDLHVVHFVVDILTVFICLTTGVYRRDLH